MNLLPDLDTRRELDFYVQDDTSIDYVSLVVRLCDCPTPTPTSSRTVTRTVHVHPHPDAVRDADPDGDGDEDRDAPTDADRHRHCDPYAGRRPRRTRTRRPRR